MTYIADNHPEAATLMQGFSWKGEPVDTELEDAEVYQYSATIEGDGDAIWIVYLQLPRHF
jgi:hypothetical protein